jgi:hypothetical protein
VASVSDVFPADGPLHHLEIAISVGSAVAAIRMSAAESDPNLTEIDVDVDLQFVVGCEPNAWLVAVVIEG